jgi:hypothetical protein
MELELRCMAEEACDVAGVRKAGEFLAVCVERLRSLAYNTIR